MTRLLVALITLAVSATVPAAPIPKGQAERPCFPTKVEAKWVYRVSGNPGMNPYEHTFTVTAVRTKDGATVVSTQREIEGRTFPGGEVTVSQDGVFEAGASRHTFDPKLPLLKSPLKAGITWTWKGTYANMGRSQTRTVKGKEVVEVPAGKFTAVRVEVVEVRNGSEHEYKSTQWYAPGVGRVKLVANNIVEEMTSFAPGKE